MLFSKICSEGADTIKSDSLFQGGEIYLTKRRLD